MNDRRNRTKHILTLNIYTDGKNIKDFKEQKLFGIYILMKSFAGQIILTTFAPISHPKFHN